MPLQTPQFDRIAVVGVGLIGGSIALAARERGVAGEVIGVGRDRDRLELARRQGIVDEFVTTFDAFDDIDLAVVCTPVDRVARDVRALLESTGPETLITDAGSVKGAICHAVASSGGKTERFVGAHPLAGSHHTGFEHARGDLFADRYCVLTPTETTAPRTTERVHLFWERLGMQVREMSPEQHDRILAVTSHIPHLAATATASLLDENSVEFAATGFRDTTRVAAGDPQLWTAICLANADQLVDATDQLISVLSEYRDAIASEDTDALTRLLAEAQSCRALFDQHHQRR
jgi:prephenate dehydrogenase